MDAQKGTCGACIAFSVSGQDADGPRGRCMLRAELGDISHTLPRCRKYVERGTGATWKPPPAARPRGTKAYQDDEEVVVEKSKRYGASIDLGEDGTMDTQALRALFEDVLRAEGLTGETPIGKRWDGGTVILKPSDPTLQAKEIPIDAFFHKVVMVRDRLRVLEQKVNAHPKLTDAEKVEMQQYVSRCYGSLTTFNVLFRDKDDQFAGQKGE